MKCFHFVRFEVLESVRYVDCVDWWTVADIQEEFGISIFRVEGACTTWTFDREICYIFLLTQKEDLMLGRIFTHVMICDGLLYHTVYNSVLRFK